MVNYSGIGRRASAPAITRLMTSALENPGLLSLAAGFTDNESLPAKAIRELVADLLSDGQPKDVLQYGTNQGRLGLRRQLAARCNQLDGASAAKYDQIVVTNGSQQALYLAMQVLADPGDIILVDRPSYFVFLEMLKGLGLRAVSMPVDAEGRLDLAALDALLERLERSGEKGRVKALYFVSYFSNPSSRSLGLSEKRALALTLAARQWHLPVLEDAAYRELYFGAPAEAPSVLAMSEWAAFPRFYLGTLTKPFATGLKVGYGICTDQEWLSRMLNVKGHQDFGSAHFNQAVLEKALEGGAYDRQVTRLREVYLTKRDALESGLAATPLRDLGWSWSVAEGGLYCWLRGPVGLDASFDGPLYAAAQREGVLYVPGDLCFGDEADLNFVRLSFGVLAPPLLLEAAQRFARAAQGL